MLIEHLSGEDAYIFRVREYIYHFEFSGLPYICFHRRCFDPDEHYKAIRKYIKRDPRHISRKEIYRIILCEAPTWCFRCREEIEWFESDNGRIILETNCPEQRKEDDYIARYYHRMNHFFRRKSQ